MVKIKIWEASIFVDSQYSSNKTKTVMFKASLSNPIIMQSFINRNGTKSTLCTCWSWNWISRLICLIFYIAFISVFRSLHFFGFHWSLVIRDCSCLSDKLNSTPSNLTFESKGIFHFFSPQKYELYSAQVKCDVWTRPEIFIALSCKQTIELN